VYLYLVVNMPILKGKCFPLAKPVVTVGAKDTVYVIPHTNEQFVSKEYLLLYYRLSGGSIVYSQYGRRTASPRRHLPARYALLFC